MFVFFFLMFLGFSRCFSGLLFGLMFAVSGTVCFGSSLPTSWGLPTQKCFVCQRLNHVSLGALQRTS